MAEEGLVAWFESLPDDDASALVDPSAGRPVEWKPGEGWLEIEE